MEKGCACRVWGRGFFGVGLGSALSEGCRPGIGVARPPHGRYTLPCRGKFRASTRHRLAFASPILPDRGTDLWLPVFPSWPPVCLPSPPRRPVPPNRKKTWCDAPIRLPTLLFHRPPEAHRPG